MSAKNRQGCCCGSSAKCWNGCGICDTVYLKNGVVHDAKGDHDLVQPRPSGAATLAWRTKPIKYTTDHWTDGDCVAKTGETSYYYEITCPQGANRDYGRGGMDLRIHFAAKQCPDGVLLYAEDVAWEYQVASHVSSADVPCDPIEVDFVVPAVPGLIDPPWSTLSVTFDVDDPADVKCQCRKCRGVNSTGIYQGLYPDGDVILSYSITDESVAEEDRVGSVRLTKLPNYGSGLADDQFKWVGDVGWWNEPSCSNPTAAPGGYNVELRCHGLSFLKWCSLPGDLGSPYVDVIGGGVGDVRYNLMSEDKVKQGTLRATDAPGAVLGDKVCCAPCDLPKSNLKLTILKSVPSLGISEVQFTGDLVYSATPYEFLTDATHYGIARWKAVVPPGTFMEFGPVNPVFYFDCDLMAVSSASPPVLATYAEGAGSTDDACDPLHVNAGYFTRTVFPIVIHYICYVDEAE